MFLTFVYLVIDLYNGHVERQRRNMFMKLLQRHLEHTSIVLRRLRQVSESDGQIISRLVKANPAGWLENILFEEKGKQILSVSPKVTIGLNGWVSYLDSQDIPILPTYPDTDYSYVLFEMSQADDAHDYLQKSFSVPVAQRVKVVDCCEPIAWKSGLPFGIVARCSTNNLIKLVDAHLRGTLCLDDMLELHQMMSVDVEGIATRLLHSSQPASKTPTPNHSPHSSQGSIRTLWETARENGRKESAEPVNEPDLLPPELQNTVVEGSAEAEHKVQHRSHLVQKPVNESVQNLVQSFTDNPQVVQLAEFDCGIEDDDATDLYEGSNESLASSVADLREVRGEVDHFAQTVEEVMTLNGDVISEMMDSMAIEGAGEGVGGESLSGPVEELAPETLTPMKRKQTMRSKPPNVLIYCGKKDSSRQFEKVKSVIEQCLNPSRYVIYHLKHNQVKTTPWSDNTVLLVLASEKAYDGMDEIFLDHLRNSGVIISFGCAFDSLFVEKIQTDTNIGMMSLSAFKQWRDVKVIRGRHVYKNINNLLMDCTLRPMVVDRSSGYPVILEANHDLSSGVAVLSQVLLDKEPSELAVNPEMFAMLKDSTESRLGILCHIFNQLGLNTTHPQQAVFTFAILEAKQEFQKEAFLKSLKPRLNEGLLRSRKLNIQFLDSIKEVPSVVTSETLPLVTDVTTARGRYDFNIFEYHKALETECLGQVLIYANVMATTMNVIDVLMFPVPRDLGVVVVAGQQTAAVGRGGNAWLSPSGCAVFSLLVRIGLDGPLGQRVSFLQHMAALAVVQGIVTLKGYEDVDLRLKWPNDIYYGSSVKLGGVVVNSSIMQKTIHANVGIGFNVNNSDPTLCLNDVVWQCGNQTGKYLKPLRQEVVIARAINWLEILIKSFEKDGPEKFLHLYYKRWLHGNTYVRIASDTVCESNPEADAEAGHDIGPEVKVIGLDEYGYLQVETAEGTKQSLHPDGNSFDMMRGLIKPKSQ